MQIERIYIKNFKSIREMEIEGIERALILVKLRLLMLCGQFLAFTRYRKRILI